MRLLIAEKPSVARAVRAVLPKDTDIVVTNVFGHVLELVEPGDYSEKWKRWDVSTLPITVSAWRLRPRKEGDVGKRLAFIKEMLGRARGVIHVGDPDREGQLLIDEVLDYFGWTGPVERMLAQATDEQSIRKALAKLQPNKKFRGLRLAAQCRQRADWLVGMNLTRTATKLLAAGGGLVSIGRVQTPTLALVVHRHHAIINFKSTTFYTFRGTFEISGGDAALEMKCEPDPRITDERTAKVMALEVVGQRVDMKVGRTEKSHLSPLPYHLGDFQKAAEKRYGWTVKHSLEALQAAYDAGLTSYPRVDCRYLPDEQSGDAVRIATAVAGKLHVATAVTDLAAPKNRVYDSSKVTVHHGIIPTGKLPADSHPEDVRLAWKLVSLRFLQTLLADETFEQTNISTSVSTHDDNGAVMEMMFKRVGERITNAGRNWRLVDIDAFVPPKYKRRETKEETMTPIPALRDGVAATCARCTRKRGQTTPPRHYSEASLRDDMSAVYKYVTDERLRKVMKETAGIGTPATQAATIETLKAHGYIRMEKDHLAATRAGISIIATVPPNLGNPGVTAAWEEALGRIERGDYDADEFMRRVGRMVAHHLAAMKVIAASGKRIEGIPDNRNTARKSSRGRSLESSTTPRRRSKASGAKRSAQGEASSFTGNAWLL